MPRNTTRTTPATIMPATFEVESASPDEGPIGSIVYSGVLKLADGTVLSVTDVKSSARNGTPDGTLVLAAVVGSKWVGALDSSEVVMPIHEERAFGPCEG